TRLREVGAWPVIYVPQGIGLSALSQIATFCVRGAYHTRHVLSQLDNLKVQSDPDWVSKRHGAPVSTNFTINLQNTDDKGTIVAQYAVPGGNVQDILKYVGFNNIPFDHSVGVLNAFMNMFYPTDNTHKDDLLGYYRQREWRLIAGDI